MNCRQFPYQTLQPDVWTECLSYLPPDKLSMASELLPLMPKQLQPTNNDSERENDDDDHAEQAAWLAVRSMVRIAEKHWEAKQVKAAQETKKDESKWNASSEEYRSSTYIWDPFELQKLVTNDTTILGDLLRKSNNRSASANSGKRTKRSFFRFRDETWQGLYGLLYKVLSDSLALDSNDSHEEDLLEFWEELFGEQDPSSIGVHDKESIALVVGLVFGAPPIPPTLMTPPVHQKLARIARACIACSSRDEETDQAESVDRKRESKPCLLSDARCYLLSLRLADEGFWDVASKILQSRSLLAVADDEKPTTNTKQPADSDVTIGDELLLSIDGMIYMCTFLIDRMYSQTYVRIGEDDQELAIAVRAGRKAVDMAGKRYEAVKAEHTITKFSSWSTFESTIETEPHNSNLPPPPMDSLFANDVLRYIHAKLALGKALALLAQHIGLDASDPDSLRDLRVYPIVQPKYESPMTTPEIEAEDFARWQRMEDRPSVRIQICWTESFFIESQKELDGGIVVCEELMSTKTGTTPSREVTVALSPLLGALKSARAERDYCAASAAYSARKPLKTECLAMASIQGFYATFKYTMERILEELYPPRDVPPASGSCTEANLDVLLRCGKDLGKACGFSEYVGVEYSQCSERFPDPQYFLDFALLVAIHKHGFFHPTSVNVARLSRQQSSVSSDQPIEQKYHAVATWLEEEYRGKVPSSSRNCTSSC